MTTSPTNTPSQATCIHCGQTKSISDLNGYDPLTNDASHAYCKQLTECDSEFAHQQIDAIRAMLCETE